MQDRGDLVRHYAIAGLTLRVESDLPFTEGTFAPKFRKFEVAGAGGDAVVIRHHFFLPPLSRDRLGRRIHGQAPWEIYRGGDTFTYVGILPEPEDALLHKVAVFNEAHTDGRIFSPDASIFSAGGLHSLTTFPTDQILLGRTLADRQGFYVHAAGMVIDGAGFLFVGHSDAGKSTTVTLLRERGKILCDDRIVVRRWPEGFRIHGTWSHGDVPDVSPDSAPLRAILFLEKSDENRLVPVADSRELVRTLPFFVIKPLVTADWWEKTLDLVGALAREVPAYRMRFDKSGRIGAELSRLAS